MDHSSLSQIDQQVLIECLLFAGLDARHFGRLQNEYRTRSLSSSISATNPCVVQWELPECDNGSCRNAEDKAH